MTNPTIPSIDQIIAAAKDPDPSKLPQLLDGFRTKTHGYTVDEALTARQILDNEVGALIEQLEETSRELNGANSQREDWVADERLWEVKADIIAAYGYDGFDDGEWIDSGY